jgi:hypothetical protein|tara:strand:- start:373 stop:552 length:180 start_codon:yes stop_codon:yes gene_type:complete
MKKETGNYKLDVMFKKKAPTLEFKKKLDEYNKLRKNYEKLTKSQKTKYNSLVSYLQARD